MEFFAQLLLNGLIAGGIYALAAVGYNMVYGALKFINFAHGSVAMVGAYIVFALALSGLHLHLVVAFFLSMVLTALLGGVIERVAYRPLRRAPKLAPLTTAVAASSFLQNLLITSIFLTSSPFRLSRVPCSAFIPFSLSSRAFCFLQTNVLFAHLLSKPGPVMVPKPRALTSIGKRGLCPLQPG